MRVLILGCGPAGLFAAHAAAQAGCEIQIISKKRRSEMFGAQYLHRSIPGLTTGEEFEVEYKLYGWLHQYLEKVYGEDLPDNVTIDTLDRKESAWDIRATYAQAWRIYQGAIESVELSALDLMYQIELRGPDLVISTVPAPTLCYQRKLHTFAARDIWAIGDAPERGIFSPISAERDNLILYNGTKDVGWYRVSTIAGYSAVEWPEDNKPPIPQAARVTKPIKTNCDCFLHTASNDRFPNYWRVGRYGAWSRFGHTHQAYWVIRAGIEAL